MGEIDESGSKALISIYGVKAEMLHPLNVEDEALAWISVHYIPSTKEWTESDVEALHEVGREVRDILKGNECADTFFQGVKVRFKSEIHVQLSGTLS